jgi:serine/threonine protein kinase
LDDEMNNEISTKKFDDEYCLLEKLGEGGSAIVRKAVNKINDQIYAVKIIRTRDPEYLNSIKTEYALL